MLMLTVLAGLPVSGTVCAMVCNAASPSAHHGSGKNCQESRRASTGPQIRDASEHNCSTHDASIPQATITAAERADGVAANATPAVIVVATMTYSGNRDSVFNDSARSGTAPPTTAPLVLRV